MAVEIILLAKSNKPVTKKELFDLAVQGAINPQTPIYVNGAYTTAGKVNGIVFGQPQTDKPIPVPPPLPSIFSTTNAEDVPLPKQTYPKIIPKNKATRRITSISGVDQFFWCFLGVFLAGAIPYRGMTITLK